VFEKIENAEKVGNIQSNSKLKTQHDANFDMDLNWYIENAVFVQKISFKDFSKVKINGYIEFMGCNDESCLPPKKEPFTFGNKSVATTTATNVQTIAPKPLATTDYWTPVISELKSFGSSASSSGSGTLWYIFVMGLLYGLLALVTPCVWPIIPMTVSFFLKRTGDKKKGQRDAMLYGLSIIFIYVILGLFITLIFGASALNSLSTSAVFNLIFFAILLLFAISFFGAFEITLPSSWSTKLDAKADSTVGIVSMLFMAFTLVLVSFSCTGPLVGTLLVQVAGSNSIAAPLVGMTGFAVALSIPFTLFALFPSWLKNMPRSGGWLNSVKVVLAFLELALALKFLSVADLAYGWHLLDREVFLTLWIVIFAMLGFYLVGKIRFSHDSPATHSSVLGVFLAIISFAFSMYMIPGLWGAPLKAISAFAPPLYTQDFNLNTDEVHPAFNDYDLGMAYAAEKKLPVVVDFSGYGCVNCRKMEASVWTDPRVKELLKKDFVLISLYVDDKTALAKPYQVNENGRTTLIETIGDKWSYLQRSKFGANAQPFYVMLDNEGRPLNSAYSFDENPVNFVKWLNRK
jgi:thiol:disulfide interchange protein DsbD